MVAITKMRSQNSKKITGVMEELMEHMQKHQKELADALALANYCQAV
jgi:UDP-N-acetylglucosamine transferase subunit ALG13